ncbi:MAG: hypothetical protein ACNI28_09765 [Arcobacter sp.]|uniref:hypothetical protein n=1 Tax=Arcobacter sp. TaxID=1872629 RepID=UPI003B001A4F
MNLHLNKRKNTMKESRTLLVGKKMVLVMISLLIGINMYADKKLDELESKSQDFFKAVTGLEHDYVKEQMDNINKGNSLNINNSRTGQNATTNAVLSKEEYSKNTFNNENEMARIKTDFIRTTTLQNLKIRSMYSFNGKDYVVLYLDDSKSVSGKKGDEMTLTIDGRYTKGDSILSHKIIAINTRTKMVELLKDVNDDYWYAIYINNNGVFMSDLRKKVKKIDNTKKTANIKNVQIPILNESCRYTVNVLGGLNIRDNNNINATILSVLKNKDEFTMKQKIDDWIEIDTIYKHDSDTSIQVSDNHYWVNNHKNYLTSNCLNN